MLCNPCVRAGPLVSGAEGGDSSAARLEVQIRRLIPSVLAVPVRHVLVTPERWILKSTAGKISRRETRLRFLDELSTTQNGAGVSDNVIRDPAVPAQAANSSVPDSDRLCWG